MVQLLILLSLLVFGNLVSAFALTRAQSQQWSRRLNRWVIRAALPALILQKIHAFPSLSFQSPEIFLPVSQPWLHFSLSFFVITMLAKAFRWPKTVWAALVLTVGLGNTSFVGLPLLRALLGQGALGTGILLDQLGSFLILSAIAAPFAQAVSPANASTGKKQSVFGSLLRPLRFPPFMALIFALSIRSVALPSEVETGLGILAMTLGPVALFSVGLSLQWHALLRAEVRQPLLTGLLLKLVLFPVLYAWIYSAWSARFENFSPMVLKTILLESAMASMITAGVVAAENELEPELAQLMVGLSVPLSLITVPLWSLILGSI